MSMRETAAALAFVCGLAVAAHAQDGPRLTFVSPAAGDYISGPTTLRVALEGGAPEVVDVTFFADGRQVCVVAAVPAACQWNAGPTVTEHALRAVARLKSGGRLVANVRTRALAFAENTTVHIVSVHTAAIEGGRFVKDLTMDDFLLLHDGDDHPIVSFTPPGAPLEIVLALDVSASMTPVLEDVKRAARLFLDRLRPEDRVTITAFNEALFTVSDRTQDAAGHRRALDELSAWAGTALYDAISRSVTQLETESAGRRALVVFSDGNDENSQITVSALEEQLNHSNVVLFTVVLGRGARLEELQQQMQDLAEITGGRAVVAESSSRLAARFEEVVEDLINQYTLGFEPVLDGEYHRLTVRVPGKGYRIRARRGYLAPAP